MRVFSPRTTFYRSQQRKSSPNIFANKIDRHPPDDKPFKHVNFNQVLERTNQQSQRSSPRFEIFHRRDFRKSEEGGILNQARRSVIKANFKSQSQSPKKMITPLHSSSSIFKIKRKFQQKTTVLQNDFQLIYRIGFGGIGKVWKVL